MPPFTACVVQTPSYPYDKAGNLQRALDTMETAAAQGASLILFPEMFLTGYLIRNKLEELSESLEDGTALAALSAKAKALSMGVLMGLPLKNPTGKPYNAIVMIDRDGSIAGVQAKVLRAGLFAFYQLLLGIGQSVPGSLGIQALLIGIFVPGLDIDVIDQFGNMVGGSLVQLLLGSGLLGGRRFGGSGLGSGGLSGGRSLGLGTAGGHSQNHAGAQGQRKNLLHF